MGTIRHHVRIDLPADEVFALVADAGGIGDWFPGVDACTFDGEVRTVSTMGIEVQERVVTNDAALRRFQYALVGGAMVPEHHLATIDVIEDGDGSIVVYSCDVRPDDLVGLFDPIYAGATDAIRAHLSA